jgi:hypothetical protein
MEARDISRSRVAPFEISLRIRHPSIDPDRISRELRLQPEHCFKAGEPRESSSGSPLTSVHAESYWLASLDTVTAATSLSGGISAIGGVSEERARIARDKWHAATQMSLSDMLDASVIPFLRPHAEFIRRLQAEEGQMSLLIELSTQALSGFTLSPQFTRVLSDLGISVEFDFVSG